MATRWAFPPRKAILLCVISVLLTDLTSGLPLRTRHSQIDNREPLYGAPRLHTYNYSPYVADPAHSPFGRLLYHNSKKPCVSPGTHDPSELSVELPSGESVPYALYESCVGCYERRLPMTLITAQGEYIPVSTFSEVLLLSKGRPENQVRLPNGMRVSVRTFRSAIQGFLDDTIKVRHLHAGAETGRVAEPTVVLPSGEQLPCTEYESIVNNFEKRSPMRVVTPKGVRGFLGLTEFILVTQNRPYDLVVLDDGDIVTSKTFRDVISSRYKKDAVLLLPSGATFPLDSDKLPSSSRLPSGETTGPDASVNLPNGEVILQTTYASILLSESEKLPKIVIKPCGQTVKVNTLSEILAVTQTCPCSLIELEDGTIVTASAYEAAVSFSAVSNSRCPPKDVSDPKDDARSTKEVSVIIYGGLELPYEVYKSIWETFVRKKQFLVTVSGNTVPVNSLLELIIVTHGDPDDVITLPNGMHVKSTTFRGVINEHLQNDIFLRIPTGEIVSLAKGKEFLPAARSPKKSDEPPTSKEGSVTLPIGERIPFHLYELIICSSLSDQPICVLTPEGRILFAETLPELWELTSGHPEYLIRLPDGALVTADTYGSAVNSRYENAQAIRRMCGCASDIVLSPESNRSQASIILPTSERIPYGVYESIIDSYLTRTPVQTTAPQSEHVYAYPLVELLLVTKHQPSALVYIPNGNVTTAQTYRDAVIAFTRGEAKLLYPSGLIEQLGPCSLRVADSSLEETGLTTPSDNCKFVRVTVPGRGVQFILGDGSWDNPRYCRVDCGGGNFRYEPADPTRGLPCYESLVRPDGKVVYIETPRSKSRRPAAKGAPNSATKKTMDGARKLHTPDGSQEYIPLESSSPSSADTRPKSGPGQVIVMDGSGGLHPSEAPQPALENKLDNTTTTEPGNISVGSGDDQSKIADVTDDPLPSHISSEVTPSQEQTSDSDTEPLSPSAIAVEENPSTPEDVEKDTETGQAAPLDSEDKMTTALLPEPDHPQGTSRAEPEQVLVVGDDGQLHAFDNGDGSIKLYDPSDAVPFENSIVPDPSVHSLPPDQSVTLISGEIIPSSLFELIVCSSISEEPISVLTLNGSIMAANTLSELIQITDGHPEYLIKLQDGTVVSADTYLNALKSPQENTEDIKMCSSITTNLDSLPPLDSKPTPQPDSGSSEDQVTPGVEAGTDTETGRSVVMDSDGILRSVVIPGLNSEYLPEDAPRADPGPVMDSDGQLYTVVDEDESAVLYEPSDVVPFNDSEVTDPLHSLAPEESATLISGETIPSHLYKLIVCSSISAEPISILTLDGSILTALDLSEVLQLTNGHPEYLIKLQDGSIVSADTYVNAVNSPQENTEAIKKMCGSLSTELYPAPSISSEPTPLPVDNSTAIQPNQGTIAETVTETGRPLVIDSEGNMHTLDGPGTPLEDQPDDTPRAEPGIVMVSNGEAHTIDDGDDSIVLYKPADVVTFEDSELSEPDVHALLPEESVTLISGETIPSYLYELIICSSVSTEPISILTLDGSILTANNLSEVLQLIEGHPEYLIKLQDGSAVSADTYANAVNSPQENTEAIKRACVSKESGLAPTLPLDLQPMSSPINGSTNIQSPLEANVGVDTATGESVVIDSKGNVRHLDAPEPFSDFQPEDTSTAEPGLVMDNDGQLHAVGDGDDSIIMYEPPDIITFDDSEIPKPALETLPTELVTLISGETIPSDLYKLIVCSSVSGEPISVLTLNGTTLTANTPSELLNQTDGHPEYLIKLQDGSSVTAFTYVNALNSPQQDTEIIKSMCPKTSVLDSPLVTEPSLSPVDAPTGSESTPEAGAGTDPGIGQVRLIDAEGNTHSLNVPEPLCEYLPDDAPKAEPGQVLVMDEDGELHAIDVGDGSITLYEPSGIVTFEDSTMPAPDCHTLPPEESVALISGERISSQLYEAIICSSVSGQPISVLGLDGSIQTANTLPELYQLTEGHPEYLIKLQDGSVVSADTFINAVKSPQEDTEDIKRKCGCKPTGSVSSPTPDCQETSPHVDGWSGMQSSPGVGAGVSHGSGQVLVVDEEGYSHTLDVPEPHCEYLPDDTPKAGPGQVLVMDEDGKLHAIDVGDDSVILYEPSDAVTFEDSTMPAPDCHTLPPEESVALISGERISSQLYEAIICSSVGGQPISVLSMDGTIHVANTLPELNQLTEGHPEYLIKLQDGSVVSADTYVNALNSPQENTEVITKMCGCGDKTQPAAGGSLVIDGTGALHTLDIPKTACHYKPEETPRSETGQVVVIDSEGQLHAMDRNDHVTLVEPSGVITYERPCDEDGLLSPPNPDNISESIPTPGDAVLTMDEEGKHHPIDAPGIIGSGSEGRLPVTHPDSAFVDKIAPVTPQSPGESSMEDSPPDNPAPSAAKETPNKPADDDEGSTTPNGESSAADTPPNNPAPSAAEETPNKPADDIEGSSPPNEESSAADIPANNLAPSAADETPNKPADDDEGSTPPHGESSAPDTQPNTPASSAAEETPNKPADNDEGSTPPNTPEDPVGLGEGNAESNLESLPENTAPIAPPVSYYPAGYPAHFVHSPWYGQCPCMRPYFVTPHVEGFHPEETYHESRSPKKSKSKKKSKNKKKKKKQQRYTNFEGLPEIRPTYTPIYDDAGELLYFIKSDLLLRNNLSPDQAAPSDSLDENHETHIYPFKPNTVVNDDDGNTFVLPLNTDGTIAFNTETSHLDALPENDSDDIVPTPFVFPEVGDILPPSSDPAYIIVQTPEGYINYVPRWAAPGREIILPSGDKHILPVFPSRFIEPSVPYHAFTTPDGFVYKVPYGRGYNDDGETSTISVEKIETPDGEVEVPVETRKRSDGSITTVVTYSPTGQPSYKTIIDGSGEVYCVPISGTTTHQHPNSKVYKTIIDPEGDEFHVPESQLKSSSYKTIVDVDGNIYEIPAHIQPVDNLRRAQQRTTSALPDPISPPVNPEVPTVHPEYIPAMYKPLPTNPEVPMMHPEFLPVIYKPTQMYPEVPANHPEFLPAMYKPLPMYPDIPAMHPDFLPMIYKPPPIHPEVPAIHPEFLPAVYKPEVYMPYFTPREYASPYYYHIRPFYAKYHDPVMGNFYHSSAGSVEQHKPVMLSPTITH